MKFNGKTRKAKELRKELHTSPAASTLTPEEWSRAVAKGKRDDLYTAYLQLIQLLDPAFVFPYKQLKENLVKPSPENPSRGELRNVQNGLGLDLAFINISHPPEELPQGVEGSTDAAPEELPQGVEGSTDAAPEELPQGVEGSTDAAPEELPQGVEGSTDAAPEELPQGAVQVLNELLVTPEKVLIFRSLLKSWSSGDPVHLCLLTGDELAGDVLLNWLKRAFEYRGCVLEVATLPTLLAGPQEGSADAKDKLLLAHRALTGQLTDEARAKLGSLLGASLDGPLRICVFGCVSEPIPLGLDLRFLELRTLLPSPVLVLPLVPSGAAADATFEEARVKLEILKANTPQLLRWANDSPYRLDSVNKISQLTSHLSNAEGSSLRRQLVAWVGSFLRKRNNSRGVVVKAVLSAFLAHVASSHPKGYGLTLSWDLTPAKFAPFLKEVIEKEYDYPLSPADGTYIKRNDGYALANFTICASTSPQDTAGTSQLARVKCPAVDQLEELLQ